MSLYQRFAGFAKQLFPNKAASSRATSSRQLHRKPYRFESLEQRSMFAAGDLDLTFSGDGFNRFINAGNDGEGNAVAVQSDGKIVVVGSDRLDDGNEVIFVARITPSGSYDDTFDGNGIKIIDFGDSRDDVGTDVKILSNGKIVVAGSSSLNGSDDFVLARLNSSGSYDTTFSGDGKLRFGFNGDDNARKIALQSDGKIVMVGTTFGSGGGDIALARVTTNGSLDNSFSGDGKQVFDSSGAGKLDSVSSLVISSNGKYIVGATTFPSGTGDFQISWFHSSGSNYRTKRMSLGGNDFLRDFVMTADGKITAVGTATFGGKTMPAGVRLTATGVFDSSFSGDGKLVLTDLPASNVQATSMAVAADGKILVGGHTNGFGDFDFFLARLNSNGTFDTSFGAFDGYDTYSFPPSPSGSDEPEDFLSDFVISGGKIIAVGSSELESGETRMAVMRVLLS
jgi:uncharacterized delta-60 repeat protein